MLCVSISWNMAQLSIIAKTILTTYQEWKRSKLEVGCIVFNAALVIQSKTKRRVKVDSTFYHFCKSTNKKSKRLVIDQ